MPDFHVILFVICIGVAMSLLPMLLPNKWSTATEIVVAIVVLIYLYYTYSFGQASILLAFGANSYGAFAQLTERNKSEKRKQLKQIAQKNNCVEVVITRQMKRLIADIALSLFVTLGAGLFLWLAPMQYAVIKMFIGLMLLTVLAQTVERIGTFYSTSAYWLPDEERLVIISLFQSRDFPIRDLQEIQKESSPDLLRLHPLFTFLTTNQDYTCSFSSVLKLSFPGEHIYLSPHDAAHWEVCFARYIDHTSDEQRLTSKKVLPIWHPTVLKRLFWKGYFAITVKGISAYTGLLFLLIWLDAPAWAIVLTVVLWWAFNVYVSDRVLIAATDAQPIDEKTETYERAKRILTRAGIPHTKLLVVDSQVYNGLATGMNIGRGTIILTSATLKLPIDAVEAIIAHEAIHIKKRDVLFIQMMRMIAIGLLIGLVYLFFDDIKMFAENSPMLLFITVYLLTMLFPAYLSAAGQWAEVRADQLGAALLPGGREQMAKGLETLTLMQHEDLEKSIQYSSSTDDRSNVRKPDTERGAWIWRVIEFQLMPHPPMYWRLQSLTHHTSLGKARKRWFIDRFAESFPDFIRRKVR